VRLKVGDPLPSVEGKTHEGTSWKSAGSRGHPLVVYFYPRDFTSGCTREACDFRDAYQDLSKAHEVEIIGISRDSVETHARFRAEHRLPFALVSDQGGSISKAFGVERFWGLLPFVKRVTFVADSAGVLRGIFHHEAAIARHLEEVRACLDSLRKG
jgi:peroxiredoxin Q/BCP